MSKKFFGASILVIALFLGACSRDKQVVYVDRPVPAQPVSAPVPAVQSPVTMGDCYGANLAENFNLQAASYVFQSSPSDIPTFVRAINDPSINRITTDGQNLHPLNVRRTPEGLLGVYDELCPQSANIATFGFTPAGSHYTMQVVGNPNYYHTNNLITAMVQAAAVRAIADALLAPSYYYWSRPVLIGSSPWFRTYRPLAPTVYRERVITRTRTVPSGYTGQARLSTAQPAQTKTFAPPVAPVAPTKPGTLAGSGTFNSNKPIQPAQTASGISSVKDGAFNKGTATAAPVTGGIMGGYNKPTVTQPQTNAPTYTAPTATKAPAYTPTTPKAPAYTPPASKPFKTSGSFGKRK
jgi:hypothetical protein